LSKLKVHLFFCLDYFTNKFILYKPFILLVTNRPRVTIRLCWKYFCRLRKQKKNSLRKKKKKHLRIQKVGLWFVFLYVCLVPFSLRIIITIVIVCNSTCPRLLLLLRAPVALLFGTLQFLLPSIFCCYVQCNATNCKKL